MIKSVLEFRKPVFSAAILESYGAFNFADATLRRTLIAADDTPVTDFIASWETLSTVAERSRPRTPLARS
jgi:hypothetical protein